MPAPGDILPSGHRLARRLPVPGGAWFVVHPGVPRRTWLALPVANPRAPAPHACRAVPLERVPWPYGATGVADLYNLDGGRLVADHVGPWPVEEVRRLLRDVGRGLAMAGEHHLPELDPERLLWFPREGRIELLPQPHAGDRWPGLTLARLFGGLLPPEATDLRAALHELRREAFVPALGTLAAAFAMRGSAVRPVAQLAGFSVGGPVRSLQEDGVGWAAAPNGATLALVADGSGGFGAGPHASAVALHAAEALALREPVPAAKLAHVMEAARGDVSAAMAPGAVASVSMIAAAITRPEGRWGACRVAVGNVGEGRAYVLRKGELSLLARDQTLGGDLVATGKMSAEEARSHPHRHVVTRSLVAHEETPLEVEPVEVELEWRAERVLLCSDGVWENVGEDELRAALLTWDPRHGARRLLSAVLDAEPQDNASAVIVMPG